MYKWSEDEFENKCKKKNAAFSFNYESGYSSECNNEEEDDSGNSVLEKLIETLKEKQVKDKKILSKNNQKLINKIFEQENDDLSKYSNEDENVAVPSTQQNWVFFKEDDKNSNINGGNLYGTVFIINNFKFINQSLKNRKGAENDSINLKKLFESLNYEVTLLENLKTKQLVNKLYEISKDAKMIENRCLILFVMSHGAYKGIYGTDGHNDKGFIAIDQIIDIFKAYDKPKLIFINACQQYFKPTLILRLKEFLFMDKKKQNLLQNPINEIFIFYATVKGKKKKVPTATLR